MPAVSMQNITGGNPQNPGSGNTATGESTFAFDTTAKELKVFDGTTLFHVPTDDGSTLPITTTNVGAKNGSTVTATEYGNGIIHLTKLTLTALPLTLADATQGAGVKIYDFPAGGITILGATGSIAETTTSALASTLNAGVTINWGVGTVTQSNGTLATTEQDILTVSNATASATINVAGATATKGRTAAPACFDGTTTAIDAFFNVGVATATDIDGDATTTYTGTIYISWMLTTDV